MPWYDVNSDVRLFYTDDDASGETSAQPLLLIHGWACDSHDWSFQIPALLAAGYRVIAADNRGHGKSSGTTGFEPRIFAADLTALLAELDSGPVVAIGHSLGGLIASALAVEHRDLVRAVVAVDPAYGVAPEEQAVLDMLLAGIDEPGATTMVAEFFPQMSTAETPTHLTTWHRRRALSTPGPTIAATLRGIYAAPDQFGRREQAERYLTDRSCPVLSFYAAARTDSAEWERSISKTDLDEVHSIEAGHWLQQEQPAEFNRLLLEWLDRLS
jgi:pimeloyl-ACP methyl ester carboxylesterase